MERHISLAAVFFLDFVVPDTKGAFSAAYFLENLVQPIMEVEFEVDVLGVFVVQTELPLKAFGFQPGR